MHSTVSRFSRECSKPFGALKHFLLALKPNYCGIDPAHRTSSETGSWIPSSAFFTNGAQALLPSLPQYRFNSYKRVVRGGRCFEVRRREVSDGGDYLPRLPVTHSSQSSPITMAAISSGFCAIQPSIGAGCCCSRRS